MENYDSIYSIALAIGMQAEIAPIQYDSTYSIAKAIYEKLGGAQTTFDSTYSIVYAIYILQGGVEQHFDSTYSILVAIDKMLGGTGEQNDVYSVMLDILENYSPTPVPTTYTVTYNSNSGEGTMTDPNSPYQSGATVTILGNSYTKEGYTFESWNTSVDGTGTEYATGSTFVITGNTTLYAQWVEIPVTYTVTYVGNGGSGSMTDPNSPYESGSIVTVLDNSYTYSGYTFENWNTSADGTGTSYATGATFTITGNTTLYAQWEEIPVPVETNYITFKGLSDGSTVGLNKLSSGQTLEYSTDAETWVGMTTATTLDLNTDDEVYVRGYLASANTTQDVTQFKSTGSVNVSGNINNIWDYNNNGADLQLLDYCGRYLFRDCSGMTFTDITLPSTGLSIQCYAHMFRGCSGMTAAPALPATVLADSCYQSMFYGCANMTTAPTISATTLAYSCYSSMFNGCTSLTTAPALPATTLADSCYQQMFNGCTSLTTAPVLSATTLANNCYYRMFYGCTSLTTTPELPATTLADYCYSNMFRGCSSLLAAPVLSASTLANYCYNNMFNGCTSLSSITCYAEDITASQCTTNWVTNVSATGTFVCSSKAGWTIGLNGIPSGWNESYYDMEYLTFTAEEANSTVGLVSRSTQQTMLQYTTDDGITWNDLTTATTITLTNIGDSVKLRGTISGYVSNSTQFTMSGKIAASGNINTLWQYPNLTTSLSSIGRCGNSLFKNCTSLTSISGLSFPATTLSSYCYGNMFQGCTSITKAPELPATTLEEGCYSYMFHGCTSLTQVPSILPATTLVSWCYANMFSSCTSLTTAPILPATTLTLRCYSSMFFGSSNLSSITCLATNIPATYCTSSWVTTVSQTGTFYKNANMSDWTTGANGIPSGWTVQDYQP